MLVIGASQLQPDRGADAVIAPKPEGTDTKNFPERFVADRIRRLPLGCAKKKSGPVDSQGAT